MSRPGRPGRRVAAVLLAVALLAAAVAAVLVSGGPPLASRVGLAWPVLVPLYVVATCLTLEFRRRDSNICVAFVQLPLALGVVLVDPVLHLLARSLASLAVSLARRQDPIKVLCNLAFAGLEVGAAVLALTVVGGASHPGPALWSALLAGLVVGDLLSMLSLQLLIRLLGMPVTRRQLAEPLVVGALTSTVWAGVAIVTISAGLTDASTLIVVLLLSAAFAVFYRTHRRLIAQQQVTEELYTFVKDLGPLDVEQPAARQALEHVRGLLHAERLELATLDDSGAVRHQLAVHLSGAPELQDSRKVALGAGLAPGNACMTTPLLAGGVVLGLLTARERVGSDRGFDLRDVRLLETVATELATALERGRLLGDLGRAATTDALTGLPNLSQTAALVDELVRSRREVLLAALAVDSFREVNDTLGHQVGDDLLREVVRRLRGTWPEALVGRIGGGRFAVACPAAAAGYDLATFGLSLRSEVEGAAQIGAVGTHVRLSVGCTRAPQDGTDAATLIRRAETAMYSARRVHGGPVLWEPAYELQGQRRLAVAMALREALAAGAIGVAFQPKLCSATRAVTGVEALARWTHPALGSIQPEEFVPLAEAAGLMGALTQTMLRQSLTACRGWQGRAPGVGVAVNVSADVLQDASFVHEVSTLLRALDVRPGLLTLELTENVLVSDPDLVADRMLQLRASGIRLSVDDFGTGYSSLTYLKVLPFDEVKIDKGFADGLVEDPADQAVVRAVVDIAHTLGLRVVAEGVELEEQLDLMRRLGVDEVQGFLHARPMPALDMSAWLRRHQTPHGVALSSESTRVDVLAAHDRDGGGD